MAKAAMQRYKMARRNGTPNSTKIVRTRVAGSW